MDLPDIQKIVIFKDFRKIEEKMHFEEDNEYAEEEIEITMRYIFKSYRL